AGRAPRTGSSRRRRTAHGRDGRADACPAPADRMGAPTWPSSRPTDCRPAEPGGGLPAAHGPVTGPGRRRRRRAHQERGMRGPPAPRLVAHQLRYEQLSFWRNPQSAFFTFVFPVVIIVIFGAVFGRNGDFDRGLTGLQYYIPTIAALSVLGACYTQLAIGLAF